MSQLFSNNASTTLGISINASTTTITVAVGTGALFPTPSAPDFFLATIQQGALVEIVKVTARTGDTLTVVRGQEGTSPNSFATTAVVEMRVTAGTLNLLEQTITSLTGDVTAAGTGAVAATVASVGGSSATNVHTAELAANAATSSNVNSTIVKRDGSGNFSASTISANSLTLAATPLAITSGGTGQITANAAFNALAPSQTSSNGLFLTSNGTNTSWIQPQFSAIGGTVAASQLPNPTATTLGGIESYTAVAHQWINAISTAGVPSSTQPATTDLSDFPSQTGQNGKFLTTNGSTLSWGAVGSGGTISGLTSTRIPYAANSTTLADDGGFVWDPAGHNLWLGTGGVNISGSRLQIGAPPNGEVSGPVTMYRSVFLYNNTTAFNANPVTGITFANAWDATPNISSMASINVGKANATSGNGSGYMAFVTRNANVFNEVMRLNENARVLVGTTTDDGSHLMQVNGGFLVGSIAGSQPIELGSGAAAVNVAIRNSNANGYPGIQFYNQGNSLAGSLGWANSGSSAPFTANQFFWNLGTSQLNFLNNGINQVAVINSNGSSIFGNGGPLNTNSTAQLEVVKNVTGGQGGTLRLSNGNGSAGAFVAIDMCTYDPGGNAPGARIATVDDGSNGGHITFSNKIPGGIGNALTERMRLNDQGRLLIGTTTDGGQLLQVNGAANFNGAVAASIFSAAISNGSIGWSVSNNVDATITCRIESSNRASIGTDFNGRWWTLQSDNHADVAAVKGGHFLVGSTTDDGTGSVLQVTGSMSVGTNHTSAMQGQLWVQKATNSGLGGEIWIANTGTAAVGSSVRLALNPDGSTDSTPNCDITSILTNVNGAADFTFNSWNGSSFGERMRVKSNGNVLIGTATDDSSGALLQVSGKVSFANSYTDNSGSPGATTINKASGRAAISSGSNSVVVTNSTVNAASIVTVQLETNNAGIDGLSVSVTGGSFTVTSMASGVATNATANCKFSFIVYS